MNNTDCGSYADDNTPYTIGNDMEDVIKRLQVTLKNRFQWLSDNKMKAKADKCRFTFSSHQNANLTLEKEENAKSICVKLLAVKIDSELTTLT